MSGSAGLTAYKLFRSLWPQKSIYETLFDQFPELGIFTKDPSFYEKYRYIDVGTAGPSGIAPTYTKAKANKGPSSAVEFKNSTYPMYAVFSIDGDLMRRSKSDKALLVDPIKRESKNAILGWKNDMCRYLHGNGGGALGQISSGSDVTTATITLTDITAIRFFRKGMVLGTSTADGTTGSIKIGSVTVKGVNRASGTVTVNEASWAAGVPTAAASDYIFRDGVFGNIVQGLEAWNPASAPGATLFRGVDRTEDTDLLGGIRIDATKKTPRAAAKAAANAVYDLGGNPNLYLLSTADWAALEADLDSAGSLMRTQVAASPMGSMNFGMSYEALKLMGPSGPIAVVATPNCPVGVGRMLTKETWVLGCMGELLHPIDQNEVEDAADAKEFRMIGDVDFYSECPGWNARVAFV